MGGFDDHVAIIGDWMPPSPSLRTMFSSTLGDDISSRSISNITIDNRSGFSFPGPEEYIIPRNPDHKNDSESVITDQAAMLSEMSEPKMNNSRGGLLDRMAARAGFNAPRLNTEHIRTANNQDMQSPFVTISPGLSPTTLLDSPVFVSNSLVQPSPTTGKFSFVSSGSGRSSSLMTEFTDKNKDNFFGNMNPSSFAFSTTPESGPSQFFSTSNRVNSTTVTQQSFPGTDVSVQSENPSSLEHQKATTLNEQTKTSAEMDTGVSSNTPMEQRTFHNIGGSMEHSPPLDEQQVDEDTDQRGNGDPNIGGAPADDGYNWRKYGQKQVKGSEYPRSYYKCTHPNCPVKKKVERSQEGHITEIVYKAGHNHPKPLPNRRSALGSLNGVSDIQLENSEQAGIGAGAGTDCDPMWTNMQRGNGVSDWRNDNPEVTSSATMGNEYCNGASSVQVQIGNQFESGDGIDGSSTFSNDEEEDDRGTHGSASLGYDGEGDESESKRRKVESYATTDMSGATRAIREPRVVVQTTSEVDILDDGYRWRKYGQKVVKGNPNPRSYYKCTSAGCTVRKHVERASHDLKSVITTYEGKHNHDVPAARNSSHVNGVSSSLPPAQTAAAAAAQTHVHRPEASQLLHHHHHHHHHSNITQFERPSSFALPTRPPLGPSHGGYGFGINHQQGLQNLAFAGLGHNQGKMAVHHYLGQSQQQMNDMGLMLPKGEPKVEPMSDNGLDMSNGGSSGSGYNHQAMNTMPLGPHM